MSKAHGTDLSGASAISSTLTARHYFPTPTSTRNTLPSLSHIQADDFVLLRAYNGRVEFDTYLNLKLRELLAGRILALFRENPGRAWEAFQRYFKELLEPLKRRSDDLYQDICVELIDNNYRRILGFDGRGSFAGYIRRVIITFVWICAGNPQGGGGSRRRCSGYPRWTKKSTGNSIGTEAGKRISPISCATKGGTPTGRNG